MDNNYFEQLNKVDCSDKVEKKGSLSYLSWAFAWGELKKRHPRATYTIYENASGCFYHTDGKTCWVKTGVEVDGVEHIEYLPVMDHRNRSISLESVTSFDVNKTVQRSLTKAVARHGLGLYIYAGEDLPEDIPVEIPRITAEDWTMLMNAYESIHGTRLSKTEIKRLSGLPAEQAKTMTKEQYGLTLRKLNEERTTAG